MSRHFFRGKGSWRKNGGIPRSLRCIFFPSAPSPPPPPRRCLMDSFTSPPFPLRSAHFLKSTSPQLNGVQDGCELRSQLFSALLSSHSFLPIVSLFFFLFHEGYHTLPINALPPILVLDPNSFPLFFHPSALHRFSFFPAPPLSRSVESITGMGAVRRFRRGELGLNSVKCPVKHINTTFDFWFLHSFPVPRRWISCGSTSTGSCLAWARRRSTHWSSTTWPNWWVSLFEKGTLTFRSYLFDVLLRDFLCSFPGFGLGGGMRLSLSGGDKIVWGTESRTDSRISSLGPKGPPGHCALCHPSFSGNTFTQTVAVPRFRLLLLPQRQLVSIPGRQARRRHTSAESNQAKGKTQ